MLTNYGQLVELQRHLSCFCQPMVGFRADLECAYIHLHNDPSKPTDEDIRQCLLRQHESPQDELFWLSCLVSLFVTQYGFTDHYHLAHELLNRYSFETRHETSGRDVPEDRWAARLRRALSSYSLYVEIITVFESPRVMSEAVPAVRDVLSLLERDRLSFEYQRLDEFVEDLTRQIDSYTDERRNGPLFFDDLCGLSREELENQVMNQAIESFFVAFKKDAAAPSGDDSANESEEQSNEEMTDYFAVADWCLAWGKKRPGKVTPMPGSTWRKHKRELRGEDHPVSNKKVRFPVMALKKAQLPIPAKGDHASS